jgi:hypothetical protein
MKAIRLFCCLASLLFPTLALHAQQQPDVEFYAGVRTLPPMIGADFGMVVPVMPKGDFVGEVSVLNKTNYYGIMRQERSMTFDFFYQWQPFDLSMGKVQWKLGLGASLLRNRHLLYHKEFFSFPEFPNLTSRYAFTNLYWGSTVHNTFSIPIHRSAHWHWEFGAVTNFYYNNQSVIIAGAQYKNVLPYVVVRTGMKYSF